MLIAEFKHYVFINMHLSLTEQDRDASLPIIQQETKHFNKPAFIAGDWNTTPDVYTAKLSIPVRNAESQALMNLCDQLRKTVKTLEFKPIKLVPGIIELCDDNSVSDWLINADYSKSRVLCYTNHKAIKYIQWMEEKNNQTSFLRKNQIYINAI